MKLMKRFLIKFFIFSIFLLIIYNGYYENRTKAIKIANNTKVYVWGDSQTVHGLDLDILRNQTNLEFYSMAVHGAGIYDFACFSNLVPDNSTVVIGISSTMFLRSEHLDYNRTRMDWKAFYYAGISGYSISTLKNIILKNYRPIVVFPTKNENYLIGSNFNHFQQKDIQETYLKGNIFAKNRTNYFVRFLQKLKEKGCSVLLIQIPRSELLLEVEESPEFSNSWHLVNSRIDELIDEKNQLNLEFSQTEFYDVTHLNRQGAKKLSSFLAHFINSKGKSSEGKIILLKN